MTSWDDDTPRLRSNLAKVFGRVRDEEHLLLDAEPFARADYRPSPRCMLGRNVVGECTIRPLAART